ncbi:C-5 cytosine methyltransferase [Metarhizium rileyi]|uniref:DNA (cytosine-5-)-methyltransferase n=1 Tax=Metarhizium rileyi (strain RCEF 4871) TaxID=1649241 RepID=A0A167DRA6_METRR|nr:C-5 cytosine methyltransferase [Metarhizium rileyi RCEF 4871]
MAGLSVINVEGESQHTRSGSVASSCTLAPGNDEPEERADAHIIDWINHVGNNTQTQIPTPAIQQPHTTPPTHRDIRIGDVIEVKNTMTGCYRVDFIQVKHVSRLTLSGPIFRGVPFTRTRNMHGRLPKKLNEVCMMLHFQSQDGCAPDDFALLIDVKEIHIVRKRNLIITNAIYPEHSVLHGRQPPLRETRAIKRHIEQSGNLSCRWKWIIYLRNHGIPRIEEEAFERISAEEVLERQFLVHEDALCNRWRGGRIRGGSWTPDQSSFIHTIDDNNNPNTHNEQSRSNDQRYTVFDAFSGAGGVSRGAQNAGFKVTHAVDKSPDVWETYTLNFPQTTLYKSTVDRFIGQMPDSPIRVDVLHISPPCQYFSPAHTVPCSRDDDNIFAQFSCLTLVKKLRPRLVTIEQTFGLTQDQHRPYFRSLIGDLTQLGYSVRWKVVALCTWGLAQTRKRLIILAAGPGEHLPSFPQATHSGNGENGLLPYTTIRQVLGRIHGSDDLHNVDTIRRFRTRKSPLDSDSLLGTVRAGLGDFYHPDGMRNYTLREYACLQGFPKSHQFRGTVRSIKSQIGNAFPPICVKLLYKHLERWLLQQDRIKPYQPEANDVMMIDAEVLDAENPDPDWTGIMNNTIDLTNRSEPDHEETSSRPLLF